MNEGYLGYLAILLGGLGMVHSMHAITTGKNSANDVSVERANKPKMFRLVTTLEVLISLGLIRLGAKMLGCI